MATPYRSTDVRPDSTPLRLSWSALALSLFGAAFTTGLAYALFRYVAGGWVGYSIASLVALMAALFAREIGSGKLGDCPRCGTQIEVGLPPHGYQCPSCKTMLDTDRGQLIVTPKSRVSKLSRFVVSYDGELVLPDCCCVCTGPTTRRIPTPIGKASIDVPYCAEHSRGVLVDPKRRAVSFRSFDYATRVCEASNGRLEGANKPPARREGDKIDKHAADSRWLGLGLAVLFAGGAALTYWGLAALDRANIEIVPTGLKGLVLWLCLKVLGRLWVTAILATLAAGFFGMFLRSFK